MLFQKRKDKPQPSKLQGEDFDIFPKVDGYAYAKDAQDQEDNEPEIPLEPTPFQKWLDALPEKKWKQYQIIAGTVLGLLCSLSIGVLSRIQMFANFSLIIALVLAMFVPNYLEKQAARKIPAMRIALIVTIVIFLAIYMFYGLVINPDFFKAAEPS